MGTICANSSIHKQICVLFMMFLLVNTSLLAVLWKRSKTSVNRTANLRKRCPATPKRAKSFLKNSLLKRTKKRKKRKKKRKAKRRSQRKAARRRRTRRRLTTRKKTRRRTRAKRNRRKSRKSKETQNYYY